ncbi:Selenocysteine-specific elongation factor [Nocardioides dokdonensis FR1436]|uniref:Selenocysteine-specific elongation factor n=1 Tax=Nocardioides dokdonensis FR1436 TaxID=1300347 RepID=A0A1A9GS17_9ACTN|nr:SelB C-terminal domain-containing protein [Nocardioides dokdonensis]ANH40392.1 Selenocysteine-specific elongation factor [Nocardioides dokdonensis FR1436]
MHVVASAGHVDHGKSTLVRALTGSDPDRLAEEKRRGLSIELGYAWTALPGIGDVAFVDVPGHERFVATMLAGVGPVPVAMLVVAADDPWMPQAAEHLAALDALGVTHGVLVVTRADLADPAPALARARDELARTGLAGVPHVVTSAADAAGTSALRAELGRVLAEVLAGVPAPDPTADVRLWVDRRFHVRGTGTVVTGTLPAGTIHQGQVLHGPGGEVRVRALESLGRARTSVTGVARVALALGGRVPDAVGRGSALVTPGAWLEVDVVDVALTGPDLDRLPERPLLHVGAAQVAVHARVLAPGLARLRLDHPLPLRVGDRAVLRSPGDRVVRGVRVLDPRPPELRRRGAARTRASDLMTLDGSSGADLALRGLAEETLLRRAGLDPDVVPEGCVRAAGWLVDPEHAASVRRRAAEVVAGSGTAGLAPAALAQRLDLPDPAIVEAVGVPGARLVGGRWSAAADPVLPPHLQAPLEALLPELSGFAAPTADRLRELGLDTRALATLDRAGALVHLGGGVVLAAGADDEALARLAELPAPFSVSSARTALGTSRRVALALLGHLDRTARTVRLADDTRRLRPPR